MGNLQNSAEQNRAVSMLSAVLAIIAISAANIVCYTRTLNAYFLADDFIHVAYLSEVFSGHPEKLLENFTGNWMHAWGTQFYRPFISLTLAFDYALGQGNPVVFHISNTVFQIVCSIFIFFISRRLLTGYLPQQQYIAALSAGLFFSVCPLHTEVVSWVIGRVDSVCLAFNLAAFYFYLVFAESRRQSTLIWSLLCFGVSLISKEMAVILPPLIVLHAFILGPSQPTLFARFKYAFKESLAYFAVLAGYFVVRTLALGTFQGGYGGSIGESLTNSLWQRMSSLSKLLLPFNLEAIPPFDRLQKYMVSMYKLTGVMLILRLVLLRRMSEQMKLLLFAFLWMILALVPTYQVFNITDSLMCSRFAYFATSALSILFAFAIAPLWKIHKVERKRKLFVWATRASCLLIGLWIALLSTITIRNNIPWAQASNQVRSFRQALAQQAATLKPNQKLVILNVPQRWAGAHLIYNGAMLSVLLSKPLSDPPLSDKVLSFEPATYGDGDLIPISRLREIAAENGGSYPAFYWDMKQRKLVKISLENHPSFNKSFDLSKLNFDARSIQTEKDGLKLDSPLLAVPSMAVDFVKVKLKLADNLLPANSAIVLQWCGSEFPEYDQTRSIGLPLICDGKEHTYFFPVSEKKSWLSCSMIERLRLTLPPGKYTQAETGLVSAEILSGESLIPRLGSGSSSMASGLDNIYRPMKNEFALKVDASKIEGCKKLAIELSKPNSWFEHYAGTLRDKKFSTEAAKTYNFDGNKCDLPLSKSDFPDKAYYQFRAYALDDRGEIIGFASDPLTIQLD